MTFEGALQPKLFWGSVVSKGHLSASFPQRDSDRFSDSLWATMSSPNPIPSGHWVSVWIVQCLKANAGTEAGPAGGWAYALEPCRALPKSHRSAHWASVINSLP